MLTPVIARRIVVLTSVAAVALALWPPDSRTRPVLRIQLFVTPDAWEETGDPLVLNEPIREFNRSHLSIGEKVIRIQAHEYDSGTVAAALSGRFDKAPDVWIPASSLWARLLRESQPSLLSPSTPSLFSSPQVFAVWDEIASRFGSGMGWTDIHLYATDPKAWRQVAGFAAGNFQLAHLNPERSTSGLSAAISEFYLAAGKSDPLLVGDVRSGEAVVEEIEGSIVHYGPTSGDILEQFVCYGPSYASVVYIQESSLRRFNAGGYDAPDDCEVSRDAGRHQLEGFFPTEGTFIADYPCISMHASDAEEDNIQAAERFCSWLADHLEQDHLEAHFFRPTQSLPRGLARLEVPDGDVLEAVQEEWREHRRPADVMVAIDHSRSMVEELDQIKVELSACLGEFVVGDRVGLVSFADTVRREVPLGRFEQTRGEIEAAVQDLNPVGATAFLDAVMGSMNELVEKQDPSRITALVVITDGFGEGEQSETGIADVVLRFEDLAVPIRSFIVEIGGEVDEEIKGPILDASQGRVFTVGDNEEEDPLSGDSPVARVCGEVFSFF